MDRPCHNPISDYRWWAADELNGLKTNQSLKDKLLAMDISGDTAYFMSVDFDIPLGKHDLFSDYPLAAEARLVTFEETSPEYKEHLDILDQNHDFRTPKLICDLHAKKDYHIMSSSSSFRLS